MGKFAKDSGSLRVLLRAISVWCVFALALLILSSAILSRIGTGSDSLGYVSSCISFLCAAAAGSAAAGKGDRLFVSGLLTAGVLLILLLTVGFLIRGREMDPSGVMSVVTFTVAGVFFGSVFLRKRQKRSGKRTNWKRKHV